MSTSGIRPIRVLYIDSDEKYASFVKGSLSETAQGPLAVEHTTNTAEAIVQFAGSLFDAILIDPATIEGDALRNCLAICEQALRVPVIVLTANHDDTFIDGLMETGIHDFLIKGQADGEAIFKAIRFSVDRVTQLEMSPSTSSRHDEGRFTILALEDNPADALILKESLPEFLGDDCEVVIVGYLCDALEQLANHRFSAAVLDLTLPDSRGLATCSALHRKAPGLPLIVHSETEDGAIPLMALQHGAADFLVKGRASVSELARSIRVAVKRRAPGRRAAAPIIKSREIKTSVGSLQETRAGRLEATDVTRETQVDQFSPPGSRRDNRFDERYQIVRAALLIPVMPGGYPDWENHMAGISSDLGRTGIGLELDTPRLQARDYIVGLERSDGLLCYAGIEVLNSETVSPRRTIVDSRFGGRGHEILSPGSLTPSFDPLTKCLNYAIDIEVLAAWCEVDVLRSFILDRVLVCPQCGALPTFRPGCSSCGSGRLKTERLIHHFACAQVGPLSEFERPEGLVCPKCRSRGLVIGSDFEYQNGQCLCEDCHWSGSTPEQVGQCLGCGYRFPGMQANLIEITGYHAQRLDALAFISTP